MSETNKHNTLYLFDGSWPFTVITRNPDGKLHFSGSDDMPENIDDDMGDPGFYVFDGTVFDAEGWTPEQCAAAGISSEAARYSEWWHGSMKPATLADVAHVFALATPPRPAAPDDVALATEADRLRRWAQGMQPDARVAGYVRADHIVAICDAFLTPSRPAARGGVDVEGTIIDRELIDSCSLVRDACEAYDGSETGPTTLRLGVIWEALRVALAHPPAVRVLDRWTVVGANGEQFGELSFSPEYAEQCARKLDVLYPAYAPHRVARVALLGAAPDAGTGEGMAATGRAALQVDDAAVGSVVVDEAMAGMATGKAGSLRETQPEIHETLVQTVHAYMEVARIGVQQNKYGDTFLRRHTSALKTARSVQDALEALILALPAAAQPTEGAGDASL